MSVESTTSISGLKVSVSNKGLGISTGYSYFVSSELDFTISKATGYSYLVSSEVDFTIS